MVAAAFASLWMRTGFPVYAHPVAMLDDGLFVRSARFLSEGHWLGPFDKATLAKGMFYPMFIAGAAWLGLPLLLAEQLVYLAASALAGAVASCFTGRRSMGAVVFVLLAANPVPWIEHLARVVRDGLYLTQTLGIITLAALLLRPGRLRPGVAGVLGLLYGSFWLTREEGVWLLPPLMIMGGASVMLALDNPAVAPGIRGRLAACLPMALSSCLAAAVCAAVVLGVETVNWRQYGVFTDSEFHQAAFARAYGTLARVQPRAWRRYVVFPREVWSDVFAQSPAARELQPSLEGQSGQDWRRFAADASFTPGETEILSGWFVWALRDAVSAAGHYRSAPEAAAFYRHLADEVDAACSAGRLRCLPPRATFAPPWHWQYVSDTLHTIPKLAHVVFTMGEGKVGAPPSDGGPADLARFADMVGPVIPSHALGTVVRGWLTSTLPASAGAPQITLVQPQDGPLFRSSLRETSPSDVTQALPGNHGVRFVLDSDCDAACKAVLSVGGEEEMQIGWDRLSTRPGLNAHGIWLNIDSVELEPVGAGTASRRQAQHRLGHIIGLGFAAVTPAAAAVALAGLSAGLLSRRLRRSAAPSLVLALGAAAAVATRIVLLSYLEATSLPAANMLYAACVTPALLLFICLGCYLVTQLVRRPGGSPASQ